MNVGSLFTGIGGFDLGLERAGMRVIWQGSDPSGSRQQQPALSIVADADSEPAERPSVAWSERAPWTAEPNVARMAHGIPNGVDRRRALGNALVPQIAEWIGRRIVSYEADRTLPPQVSR